LQHETEAAAGSTGAARLVSQATKNLPAEFSHGAGGVLESIDILDADVDAFVARLDESLSCVMANSVVFFSQQATELERGEIARFRQMPGRSSAV